MSTLHLICYNGFTITKTQGERNKINLSLLAQVNIRAAPNVEDEKVYKITNAPMNQSRSVSPAVVLVGNLLPLEVVDSRSDKNPYYHGMIEAPKKGCNLVKAQKEVGQNPRKRASPRVLFYALCLVHGADVCRCGWEFKHHPVNQC